jgi:hypothetical protein
LTVRHIVCAHSPVRDLLVSVVEGACDGRNIESYDLPLHGHQKGAGAAVLKALILLAVKETELIFGRTRCKLETTYRVFPEKAVCTIEGGTECGEHLAKLLSGFLIMQVGEEGFRVNRF